MDASFCVVFSALNARWQYCNLLCLQFWSFSPVKRHQLRQEEESVYPWCKHKQHTLHFYFGSPLSLFHYCSFYGPVKQEVPPDDLDYLTDSLSAGQESDRGVSELINMVLQLLFKAPLCGSSCPSSNSLPSSSHITLQLDSAQLTMTPASLMLSHSGLVSVCYLQTQVLPCRSPGHTAPLTK